MLLLVNLFTLYCILFQSLDLLLELGNFLLKSCLGCLDLFILKDLQLLLLLLPQCCQILDFLLIVINSCIFFLHPSLKIINPALISKYLSI